MPLNTLCPCHSQKAYSDCCEPYLLGKTKPKTPLALMRSRYTAFTQANGPYIKKTMRGAPLKTYDEQGTIEWARGLVWTGLEILSAPEVKPGGLRGTVEFIARYTQDGKEHEMHEHSLFKRDNNTWYYCGEKPTTSQADS